jgi:hypothetical protein
MFLYNKHSVAHFNKIQVSCRKLISCSRKENSRFFWCFFAAK